MEIELEISQAFLLFGRTLGLCESFVCVYITNIMYKCFEANCPRQSNIMPPEQLQQLNFWLWKVRQMFHSLISVQTTGIQRT